MSLKHPGAPRVLVCLGMSLVVLAASMATAGTDLMPFTVAVGIGILVGLIVYLVTTHH